MILIVEDSADAMFLTLEALQRRELPSPVGVSSAEAAMALQTWADIEVAILDWHLPGLDGVSLADWISHHHPHVYIIILTSTPESLRMRHPRTPYEVVSKGDWPWALTSAVERAVA